MSAKTGTIDAPKYRIDDGAVWLASRWHSETGECIGWDKVGDVAYCVHGDGELATHTVATFNVDTDALVTEFALCKRDAAKAVFGHGDTVYARSRELDCPGLVEVA